MQLDLLTTQDPRRPDRDTRPELAPLPGWAPSLLAPLRLRVDNAQAKCREILASLPDEAQGTILHDLCTDAVKTLRGIPPRTREVWRAVMDAENRRNGYDTWDAKELRAHIKAIDGLHTAMVELSRAVWTLSDAERREVDSLLPNAEAHPAQPKGHNRNP